MLISTKDVHVPTKSQLKTWDEFGKPKVDFVPVGHYFPMFLASTLYLSRDHCLKKMANKIITLPLN